MPADATADWIKFWELIKDIKFAMFTAHANDGHMHSRPMTTQNRGDDRANVLWFFMSRSSEPVLDIAREWSGLVQAFTGGDTGIEQSVERVWQEEDEVHGFDAAGMRDLMSWLAPAMEKIAAGG